MVKSSTRVQRKFAKRLPHTDPQQPRGQEACSSGNGSEGVVNSLPRAALNEKRHSKQHPEQYAKRNAKKERPQLLRSKKPTRSERPRSAAALLSTTVVPVVHRGGRTRQRGVAGKRKTNGSSRLQSERSRVAGKLVAKQQQQQQQQDEKRRMTAAEARLESAKVELELFDRVVQVPTFTADPFLAIEEHLTKAMEFLQPQTPDVGRRKDNS